MQFKHPKPIRSQRHRQSEVRVETPGRHFVVISHRVQQLARLPALLLRRDVFCALDLRHIMRVGQVDSDARRAARRTEST